MEGKGDAPWAGLARPTPPSSALPRPMPSSLHHALPRVTPFIPALPSSASPSQAPPLPTFPPRPAPSPRHAPLPSGPSLECPSAERYGAPKSVERAGCRGGAGSRACELCSPRHRPLAEAPWGQRRLQPGLSALASAATASVPLEEFLGKAGPEAGIVITESLRRAAVVPGPALGS